MNNLQASIGLSQLYKLNNLNKKELVLLKDIYLSSKTVKK